MPAPEGNDYWKARCSHGRRPVFATPEALWESAVEYFEWVTANPIETTFYRGKVFECVFWSIVNTDSGRT